jgi:DNA-binding CsgD family transcriptional regulator
MRSAEGTCLDSVLTTAKLAERSSRPPDILAECKALAVLANALARGPQEILGRLAETALQLCQADSGGISMLERSPSGDVFRWRAIAGTVAEQIGGTIPRAASPCGIVIERDTVVLFDRPERHFATLAGFKSPFVEVLLAPFHVNGVAVGTVWAISHREERRFDAEDARLLTSICEFASAAYQIDGAAVTPSLDEVARADLLERLSPKNVLSEREAEVVRLIAEGHAMKRIASMLTLSTRTIETYKTRAMEKLGSKTRADIVRYAVERGWLDRR